MRPVEPVRQAERGNGLRFSEDVLLWDADDPEGITVLRAASRSRWQGRSPGDWFSPQTLDELRFWGRMAPQRSRLPDGTEAQFLPVGAIGGAVWLVLPGATPEDADAWWALLSPEGISGNLSDGDALADAFGDWILRLASAAGCGVSLDVSGLRGQGWLLPFSADALIGVLLAAMLEARSCAADRSLAIRVFAAEGESGRLLRLTLTVCGEWPEHPLWLRLAEGGNWQVLPEQSDRHRTVCSLSAVHLRQERLGLKNPLPWRG